MELQVTVVIICLFLFDLSALWSGFIRSLD